MLSCLRLSLTNKIVSRRPRFAVKTDFQNHCAFLAAYIIFNSIVFLKNYSQALCSPVLRHPGPSTRQVFIILMLPNPLVILGGRLPLLTSPELLNHKNCD